MGFYPVNPVSGEYVVGSYVDLFFIFPSRAYVNGLIPICFYRPFFDRITIALPPRPGQKDAQRTRRLTISAPGAPTKPYIKSLTVNGRGIDTPIIRHKDIADGGEIVFEMSDVVQEWGNGIFQQQLKDTAPGKGAAAGSEKQHEFNEQTVYEYPDHVEL
ncbi:hypothetical protein H0H81_005987 [Sphagnurus paluster]|uniref:Glycosyl hydrolase family 92 domain-containing protein n=1 Tax=Sphagnurus paluster TaxID=117069 RepID=A0A9P7GPC6_9AGAR|nr:hypothetical protein H0H81_005987 [Sphagnurus paluster]